MKRSLQIITFLLTLISVMEMRAQEVQVPRFGYLSYDSVYQHMPEYAEAQRQFAELKAHYEAEATRAEEEFQRKFAEFLQGQKDFPASILQKRQAELQELMDKSISFRQQSQQLLQQAEADLQRPVSAKLNAAIQAVGAREGLLFIINTDDNACPFVHPQAGIDVKEMVILQLSTTD